MAVQSQTDPWKDGEDVLKVAEHKKTGRCSTLRKVKEGSPKHKGVNGCRP
jgi:hypothetical protein